MLLTVGLMGQIGKPLGEGLGWWLHSHAWQKETNATHMTSTQLVTVQNHPANGFNARKSEVPAFWRKNADLWFSSVTSLGYFQSLAHPHTAFPAEGITVASASLINKSNRYRLGSARLSQKFSKEVSLRSPGIKGDARKQTHRPTILSHKYVFIYSEQRP